MDSSTTRFRAVSGTAAFAKSGRPRPFASSTSRDAPSMMTPATPRVFAAVERMPPQPATSVLPRWSQTMMSPGSEASTAAVPRWRVVVSLPFVFSLNVTARPAMRPVSYNGRMPRTVPFMPSLSCASETAQVSNWLSRSTHVSTAIASLPSCQRRYPPTYAMNWICISMPPASASYWMVWRVGRFSSSGNMATHCSFTSGRMSRLFT